MKKTKFCEICLERGIEVEDDTTHNLLNCVCIKEEEYAATLLEEIFRLAKTMNSSEVEIFHQLRIENPRALSLFILNPTSHGNSEQLRIHHCDPRVKLLFKLTQKYCLVAHNLRRRNGVPGADKQKKERPRLSTRRGRPPGGSRHHRGRWWWRYWWRWRCLSWWRWSL